MKEILFSMDWGMIGFLMAGIFSFSLFILVPTLSLQPLMVKAKR